MEWIAWAFFIVSASGIIIQKIVEFSLRERNPVPVRYNDGGRRRAGYKGVTGDCVTRSIAIATGQSYQVVYDVVDRALKTYRGPKENPDKGVIGWMTEAFMEAFDGEFHEVPEGTYLRPDTIPYGTLVVWLKGHTIAVIDKVAYDTFEDPYLRKMYGYWVFPDRSKK